jgi:hypothetical protein
VAARCWLAVATFFGDLLEHPLIEEQFGDEDLETLDRGLECVDAPGVIDLGGVVALPPAVIGALPDAELAAHVGNRKALGEVAVSFPKQAHDLVGGPSLAHESLLDLFYPELGLSQRVDQILGSRPSAAPVVSANEMAHLPRRPVRCGTRECRNAAAVRWSGSGEVSLSPTPKVG